MPATPFRAEKRHNKRLAVILPPGHRVAQRDALRLADRDGGNGADRLARATREGR